MNRLSHLPCRSATGKGFVYIVGPRRGSNQAGSPDPGPGMSLPEESA